MRISFSRPQRPPVGHRAPAQGAPTLTITRQLLAELRDSPLAIGLYIFIARLFIIHKQALALSATDIAAYDPQLTNGAITRAADRLERGGWLIIERRGNKNHYLPAWGRVAGQVRPWTIGAPLLDRPRHLAVAAFNSLLLDIYLGRIEPCVQNDAIVSRYASQPLLGLRDAGAYLLAQTGLGSPTPALEALGLAADALVRPVPAEDEALAQISQLALRDADAPTLSEHGLRRLGLPIPAADLPLPDPRQTMIFYPPEQAPLIGELIGGLIGSEALKTPPETVDLPALKADKSPRRRKSKKNTGNQRDLNHDSPPSSPVVDGSLERHNVEENQPDPPTVEALKKLDISARVIRELRHAPTDLVDIIIKKAHEGLHIRDVGGWVVAALRKARGNGWQCQLRTTPPAASQLLDLSKYTEGIYADVFNPDRLPEEVAEPLPPDTRPLREIHDIAALDEFLKDTLMRCARGEEAAVYRRVQLIDKGAVPVFACATPADLAAMHDGLDGLLERFCGMFGWVEAPQFVLAGVPAASAPPAEAQLESGLLGGGCGGQEQL